MLGGDIVVFAFMFYLCFLFHIWYIDFDLYYEVIYGICLLFYVLWNQEVYYVLLVFSTHAYMRLFSVSGIYRLIQSWLLSTFANDRW